MPRSPALAPFVAHTPEFRAVLGQAPRLELVMQCDAHEGPVYAPDEDALYFTSLPDPEGRVDIRRIALDGDRFPLERERLSTLRARANVANGMTLGGDGRLLVCEQGTRETAAVVAAIDRATGRRQVLVDEWAGLRLNSPNDIVVRSDGTVWFTDPGYGHLQGFRPPPQVPDRVYRYDPATAELSVVTGAPEKPNGLAFSADERTLYVTDSGANQEPGSFHPHLPHEVVAFDVVDGRRVGPPRTFAVIQPGFPDGIEVDAHGRVYVSSFSGVQVFSPGAEPIGEIALPGAVNFTFGGRAGDTLFVTTDDAVWAAVLEPGD